MVKGKTKRKIYFAGGRILSFFNRLVPKRKDGVCFFCKSGINDNSEALLSYMIEHGYAKDYKICCVVGEPGAYRRYQEQKVRVCGLLPGVWALLRCRYIFCHGENLAIMPSKKQISVNYWHGTPLKKINRMLPKLGDYRYDFFTYTTAAAEMFRPVFAQAFGCRPEQVLINGHPRNDYLFQESTALEMLGIRREDYRKVFLWMPTYRLSRDGLIRDTDGINLENAGVPLFHTREAMEDLNRFLEEKESLLLLKLHPAQKVGEEDLKSYPHIRILTNRMLEEKAVPLYRVVRQADALLTDYSSVFFDYLLLDRPEAFVLEDLEAYQGRRGFVVEDPLSYMPGEKIYDRDQLYAFLEDCLEGRDRWQEERARVNALVNGCQEEKNCQMLLEQIGLKKA
ncbi:MAG: CDP-glycerol glycerophosphotransferase family protein [Blautia sp.]|jgi:CDP-glycerol glycerophosphotransferase (TagB/SpsB family)